MPEQSEQFPGIDVDALELAVEDVLLDRLDFVGDLPGFIVPVVLQRLAEDGRLGVEKEFAAESLMTGSWYPVILEDEATHYRLIGPWLPVVKECDEN